MAVMSGAPGDEVDFSPVDYSGLQSVCKSWITCKAPIRLRRRPMATTDQTREQSVVEAVQPKLFIAGEWRDARGGETLPVEDPSTGEALVEIADGTPADADAALTAAAGAQADWAATAPRERGEILRRAYEKIIERADDL